jgi:hypothetical protein
MGNISNKYKKLIENEIFFIMLDYYLKKEYLSKPLKEVVINILVWTTTLLT